MQAASSPAARLAGLAVPPHRPRPVRARRLVDVVEGVVTIELSGHCRGCTASQATLRGLVEQALRQHVPGFRRMEMVQPAEPVAPHPPPAKPLISLEQLMANLQERAGRPGNVR